MSFRGCRRARRPKRARKDETRIAQTKRGVEKELGAGNVVRLRYSQDGGEPGSRSRRNEGENVESKPEVEESEEQTRSGWKGGPTPMPKGTNVARRPPIVCQRGGEKGATERDCESDSIDDDGVACRVVLGHDDIILVADRLIGVGAVKVVVEVVIAVVVKDVAGLVVRPVAVEAGEGEG